MSLKSKISDVRNVNGISEPETVKRKMKNKSICYFNTIHRPLFTET
jgi:hypothetical protein